MPLTTDQLAAPLINDEVRGRECLHRYVRSDADAAVHAAWTNLKWVQSVTVSEPTYETERTVLHQGSKDKTVKRYNPRWDITINVLSGKMPDVIAAFRGATWGATNTGVPLQASNDDPQVHIESIFRGEDNETVVFSRVIQDFILDSMGHDNPMDVADGVIRGHSYYPPFMVYTGYEAQMDVWDATPTTVTYTLSDTPATITTASSHDQWEFDNCAFIKNKDNSESDTTGGRLVTGVSISGVTMTFTTGTPAASDKISCLYVKAV